MILYPAIDLLDGRAVRLRQGRREDVTDFGDPVALARRWRSSLGYSRRTRASSTSLLMTSLIRSRMSIAPRRSRVATSPVCSQPPAHNSAPFSGSCK